MPPAILRHATISQDVRAKMLATDPGPAPRSAEIQVGGRAVVWTMRSEGSRPQDIPAPPGYWQDAVLANVDVLAGVMARESLARVAATVQIVAGGQVHSVALELSLQDLPPDTVAVVDAGIPASLVTPADAAPRVRRPRAPRGAA